ncbi:MAG: DUF6516 family protein, partial [Candidatus Latescibacterota bacterium]
LAQVRTQVEALRTARVDYYHEQLLPRYDDARHHPEVSTHPQHRHQNTATTVGPRLTLESFPREVDGLTGV